VGRTRDLGLARPAHVGSLADMRSRAVRLAGWGLAGALAFSVSAVSAEPAPSAEASFRGARSTEPVRSPSEHRPLSESERRALMGGQTVERPMRFEQGGGTYVGGVAYQVVPAPPHRVMAALLTVPDLPRLLPRTKRARLVGARDNAAQVELVQGNSLVEATYTLRLVPEPSQGMVRFWLDRSRAHDISDVWGYFRVQPHADGHTLLTVAVALDVGDGLVRMLFEDHIQRIILSAPRQIRDYLQPRVLAEADSA